MLVSEDNGPYESISDGVRALSDAKVEEDRLGSYLLSAGAHGVPAHLVEYYAYFVHLQSERKGFKLKYIVKRHKEKSLYETRSTSLRIMRWHTLVLKV